MAIANDSWLNQLGAAQMSSYEQQRRIEEQMRYERFRNEHMACLRQGEATQLNEDRDNPVLLLLS